MNPAIAQCPATLNDFQLSLQSLPTTLAQTENLLDALLLKAKQGNMYAAKCLT